MKQNKIKIKFKNKRTRINPSGKRGILVEIQH